MVKTINLTNSNEITLVDDEDYDYLNQWNWQLQINKTGQSIVRGKYINEKNYTIYMARVIAEKMGLNIKNKEVDHKDRDPLNNQKLNLRIATRSQNKINQGLRKNNISGFKGVYFESCTQKYRVEINVNGKRISLGRFLDPIEAAYQYDHYAKQYHGEFAVLNFPESG